MKNNIIIAGVPRAGKSTVSHILSQEYGYQHVSMDSIIAGFEKIYTFLHAEKGVCKFGHSKHDK
jgi:adenylate kinase family enzyme